VTQPNYWGASIDSVEDEDEEADKRNGGVSGNVTSGGRRASKLSDLFTDKKRRPDRKRWKDKQGNLIPAIDIIRDEFWPILRPPLPMCHLLTLARYILN